MKFQFRKKAAPQEAQSAAPAGRGDPGQAQAAPENPYVAARREWMERYGTYIQSAHHWRIVAFGSLFAALLSIGGLVAVSMQVRVVPYNVEFNKDGEVVKVQRADVLTRPAANQIRASLRTWVVGARSVYTDAYALRTMIDATYSMTLPNSPAFQQLAEYHRANNPYERTTQNLVTVDVKAVVPVSDKTWQVEWTETTRTAGGKPLDQQNWQGVFTVKLAPPVDAAQIMANPLGLYVQQFSWTQRLDASR